MRLLWCKTRRAGRLLLCAVVTGCVHQQLAPPPAPQAKTPNIYIPPPGDKKLPPMQTGDTPPNLTDVEPAEAAEVKPKKKPKKQSPPAPSQTAVNPPITPPASETTPSQSTAPSETLGALAPGGGSADPKQQQEVMAKIGVVEKRISDLPGGTADREQKQIAKVRQFLKEASDALKSGDAEGAGILATKAELLMDDLTK